LYEFLRIFLISENSLKFANFFAEVTNSRSMDPETQTPVGFGAKSAEADEATTGCEKMHK